MEQPHAYSFAFRALFAIFAICTLFWILRRLFDTKFGATFRKGLLFQIFINLLIISLAIAITSGVLPLLHTLPLHNTFDTVTVLELMRIKLLTYLNLLLQVTIYTVVVHSWRLKQKALELEMSLKQSEIALLRIQTNPHFLFNTLNLLHNEIPQRPELAQEIIFELSDLLRSTIEIADKQRISLSDEVDLIGHYLTIQKARFSERLDVSMDIDPSSESLLIPPMLIMPLVENVIKHALSKTIKHINLEINTRYIDGELSIMINNSWPEAVITPKFEPGSGLGNITKTLNLEYVDASFSIAYANNTTRAQIIIRDEF